MTTDPWSDPHRRIRLTDIETVAADMEARGLTPPPPSEPLPPPLPESPSRWKLRALSEVTSKQTRWLVTGLIPLRNITLVAAVGGAGKSHWLLALRSAGLSGRGTSGHDLRLVRGRNRGGAPPAARGGRW